MPDGTVEIITGKERRRRWSVEEKLRIVAEAEEAGARITEVAARNEVYPSLLFNWRRQVREGRLVPDRPPQFVPVRLISTASERYCITGPCGSTGQESCWWHRDQPAGWHPSLYKAGSAAAIAAPVDRGTARMIAPAANVRVWLACGHSDMRRGFDGLSSQVQQHLGKNPFTGELFVFRGRRGDLIKNSLLGRPRVVSVQQAPRERAFRVAPGQRWSDFADRSTTVNVARRNRLANAGTNLAARDGKLNNLANDKENA